MSGELPEDVINQITSCYKKFLRDRTVTGVYGKGTFLEEVLKRDDFLPTDLQLYINKLGGISSIRRYVIESLLLDPMVSYRSRVRYSVLSDFCDEEPELSD